jgi:predicted alpha/beta hydrolase family esterase
MKTSDVDILLCVDRRVATADHWVSRWSRNLKTGRLVDVGGGRGAGGQAGAAVLTAVAGRQQPVVLVGYHSGVAAIVAAAQSEEHLHGAVRGTILVAPPKLTLVAADTEADGLINNAPLPFPSLMIASQSDPRCSFEHASDLALAWGSHLVDAGEAGRIDTSSGHGPWPEGLMRLGWFLKRLS